MDKLLLAAWIVVLMAMLYVTVYFLAGGTYADLTRWPF